jgi:hypothetical protein
MLSPEFIDILKTLGLPTALVLILGYFLMKFIMVVWNYTTRKLDEKDAQIKENILQHIDFREKLLIQQDKICTSQDSINISLNSHLETLREIKEMLRTKTTI